MSPLRGVVVEGCLAMAEPARNEAVMVMDAISALQVFCCSLSLGLCFLSEYYSKYYS
ncbi:hypothetical protein OIU76_020455, partial [Salix suchowensis]